jgi:hypothetical protein
VNQWAVLRSVLNQGHYMTKKQTFVDETWETP